MTGATLHIEVVYAEPAGAIVKSYLLAEGSTVADALRVAALDADFPAVEALATVVGIFGRVVRAEQALKQGDRVELYRPLAADPKVVRRARAKAARGRA